MRVDSNACLDYSPPASPDWTTDQPHSASPQLYPQKHLQEPMTCPGAYASSPTDFHVSMTQTTPTCALQPSYAPPVPGFASQAADNSPPHDSPYISPPTISKVKTTSPTQACASRPPDASPAPAPASRPPDDSLPGDSSPIPSRSDCGDYISLFGDSDEKSEMLPAQPAAHSPHSTLSVSDWVDFSKLVNDLEDYPDTAPGGISPTMSNEAFAAMLLEARDDGR